MPVDYQTADPFASSRFVDLTTFVRDSLSGDDRGDFEEFERELHRRFMALEAEVVKAKLERYDVEAEIEFGGERFRPKGRFEKEYHGLAGSFVVTRTLHVPVGGKGKSVVPLELRAGIVEGAWTPWLARLMVRTVACTTPKEAAELFEEFGGATPSASSLDRLPKRLSRQWEELRVEFEEELRQQETVPASAVAVAVTVDGVLTPMKTEGEESSEARESTQRKKCGPTDYRESSCGTVSYYDAEGERLETIRYAQAPEYKKATLKSQLTAELESIWAVRSDLKLMLLSDGAPDHWEFLSELPDRLGAETARRAVDLFHVLERIKKALDAYHGAGSSEARSMFETCRLWLRQETDGADRVLRALRYRRDRARGSIRKAIAKEIKYIENRKRERLLEYKQLLDENLPVGSGVVEAACKTLVSERLKRSGMSWSEDGAQAILTFRSLIQSNRWDRGWKLLSDVYRRDDMDIAA